MRRWHLLPIFMVGLIVVALPLLALTDSDVELDLREKLGLETFGCRAMTNAGSPWQPGPDLPFLIDEPRAAALDGDIYIAGGITGFEELADGLLLLNPSDRVLRFDPERESYRELPPLPRPLNHIGIVGYQHSVYVFGGYGRRQDKNTSRAFYRYEPRRNRWSRMPDMPAPAAAMAAAVIGDRLIVAAGARDTVPVPDAFAFDFGSGRWSRLADMPDAREHVGSAALDGDLYVLGGRTNDSFAVTTASRYEADEGRWQSMPPMPQPTGGLSVVVTDSAVLAIGGGNDGAGTVTGAVQEWDPQSETWTLRTGMRTPRHGHAAAVADGKIWVFGGSPCAYFNATDNVEWLPLP